MAPPFTTGARRGLCIGLLAAALAVPAAGQGTTAPRWRDDLTGRLAGQALVQTLNARLLAASSATAVLEAWCREHALAAEGRVVAERLPGAELPPPAEVLQRLGVGSPGEVRHRRVRLRCGARVLSEADNWYVPARLTPEMNRRLDGTNAPFGRVVSPLRPYRRTGAVAVLWVPLPPGWERRPPRGRRDRPLAVPAELLEHRAVLYTAEHLPFAEVHERYQDDLLAFLRE